MTPRHQRQDQFSHSRDQRSKDSFSICVLVSRVQLFVTPRTIAHQAPGGLTYKDRILPTRLEEEWMLQEPGKKALSVSGLGVFWVSGCRSGGRDPARSYAVK